MTHKMQVSVTILYPIFVHLYTHIFVHLFLHPFLHILESLILYTRLLDDKPCHPIFLLLGIYTKEEKGFKYICHHFCHTFTYNLYTYILIILGPRHIAARPLSFSSFICNEKNKYTRCTCVFLLTHSPTFLFCIF